MNENLNLFSEGFLEKVENDNIFIKTVVTKDKELNVNLVGTGKVTTIETGTPKMTIKELSKILNCSRDLIEKTIKKEMPKIMSKGKTTRLDEMQVTAIKLLIQSDNNFRQVSEVKTDLEKKLLIKQGYDLLMEEVVALQDENKQLKIEKWENAPKVELHDQILDSTGNILPSIMGKILNTNPNKFTKWLVDEKILFRSKGKLRPMAIYQLNGYLTMKPSLNALQGVTYDQTYFTPEGVLWITKRWNKRYMK